MFSRNLRNIFVVPPPLVSHTVQLPRRADGSQHVVPEPGVRHLRRLCLAGALPQVRRKRTETPSRTRPEGRSRPKPLRFLQYLREDPGPSTPARSLGRTSLSDTAAAAGLASAGPRIRCAAETPELPTEALTQQRHGPEGELEFALIGSLARNGSVDPRACSSIHFLRLPTLLRSLGSSTPPGWKHRTQRWVVRPEIGKALATEAAHSPASTRLTACLWNPNFRLVVKRGNAIRILITMPILIASKVVSGVFPRKLLKMLEI